MPGANRQPGRLSPLASLKPDSVKHRQQARSSGEAAIA
jgi:hypothetical protein